MADTPAADAATTAEHQRPDAILDELERAIANPPADQVALSVAIEKGKTAIREILDAVEEYERIAKTATPSVEPEHLASQEKKLAEMQDLLNKAYGTP